MTREEAIEFIKNIIGEESGRCIGKEGFYAELIGHHIEALKMAIKALDEDAISRKAVIQHICESKDCYKENCKGVLFNRCMDITWVNELPSVSSSEKSNRSGCCGAKMKDDRRGMKRYYAAIEAPDNLKPRYNKESVDFFFTGEDGDPEIITTEMIEGDGWHGLDETPKEGDYILISFANYSLPDIGRYEDGVFYPGDEEKSYKEYGLIVNGWQKLPKSRGADE